MHPSDGVDLIEGILFIMEQEIWKDIDGYNGDYQVSNFGRVKSFKGEKGISELILKPAINHSGYETYKLWFKGKPTQILGHQLVAIAFLGHSRRKNIFIIDHIDGNKVNNVVSNLHIVTSRENMTTCFLKNKHKYTSQYVGVYFEKSRNKWSAQIDVNKKRISLGRFVNEIDAANAYQNKLKEITNGNK